MNAPRTSTTGLCVDTEESDSILGTKTVGDGIHSELEPVNRFIITQKTNTLTAECQITAQHSIFTAPPPHARRSVTMEQRDSRSTATTKREFSRAWIRTSLTPTPHGNTETHQHHTQPQCCTSDLKTG